MPNIEFDVRGLDSLLIELQAKNAHLAQEIKEVLQDAGDAAESVMRAEVPRDSGALANSIRLGPVVYMPGGFGGGGNYQMDLTVGEGIPYLAAVVEGSGIFGPSRERIYPSKGNGLAFEGGGGRGFPRWGRGHGTQGEGI